jgi:hypothetical protein
MDYEDRRIRGSFVALSFMRQHLLCKCLMVFFSLLCWQRPRSRGRVEETMRIMSNSRRHACASSRWGKG